MQLRLCSTHAPAGGAKPAICPELCEHSIYSNPAEAQGDLRLFVCAVALAQVWWVQSMVAGISLSSHPYRHSTNVVQPLSLCSLMHHTCWRAAPQALSSL